MKSESRVRRHTEISQRLAGLESNQAQQNSVSTETRPAFETASGANLISFSISKCGVKKTKTKKKHFTQLALFFLSHLSFTHTVRREKHVIFFVRLHTI